MMNCEGENTMDKGDKLAKFRQKISEITHRQQIKQALLDKELSQRLSPPQVGDIFISDYPKTVGFEWVALCTDENEPQRFLIVPADDAPMVGSTDIELPDNALYSPLTLRCDQSLWIHNTDFRHLRRVGILEEWHRLRALDKVKQISEKQFRVKFQARIAKILKWVHSGLPKLIYHWLGDITQLRSSVLHQNMNYEPDYVAWKGEVSKARTALAVAFNHPVWSIAMFNKLKKAWKTLMAKLQGRKNPESEINHGGTIAISPRTKIGLLTGLLSGAVAVFLVAVVISWYQDLSHQNELRNQFQFAWVNVVAQDGASFAPSGNIFPTIYAFSAGVWQAQQQLNLSSPPSQKAINWLQKDWLKTDWASYFKLGYWTLLMEVKSFEVVHQNNEVPEAFF